MCLCVYVRVRARVHVYLRIPSLDSVNKIDLGDWLQTLVIRESERKKERNFLDHSNYSLG